MKRIRVIFMAYDRKSTEYFPIETTDEKIRIALHKICSTYYILSIKEVNENQFI